MKTTQPFVLRNWRMEDAETIAQYADNPKIAANLRDVFPSPYTLRDAQAFIAECVEMDEKEKLFFAIDVDGKAIGRIGVTRGKDVYRKSAEIGYWLAEPFWNRRIMSCAIV